MKKLQLKFGKEMLSKEQMKKVAGGDLYSSCGDYIYVHYAQWFCCDPSWGGSSYMGTFDSCYDAYSSGYCYTELFKIVPDSPYNCPTSV